MDVELVDGHGAGDVRDRRELRLWVEPIGGAPQADLDHDGDVDDDDLALIDAAIARAEAPRMGRAVADASIRPGPHADQNFDDTNGPIVPVELDDEPEPVGEHNWKGYIKFDVSELAGADGIELILHTSERYDGPSPPGLRIDVFGLIDGQDGWDEEEITWNNAPANVDHALDLVAGEVFGGGPLGTLVNDGPVDRLSSAALDRFVGEGAGEDGRVTLVLVVESDTAQDGDSTVFVSHEDAGRAPVLVASPGEVGAAVDDLDHDGRVDETDRALLLEASTGPLSGDVDRCWGRQVRWAVDRLLEIGTDRYGDRRSAMLTSARRWAFAIEADLPPRPGRRFGHILREHLPAVDATGGTYADNYGRAISFFVGLHHATCAVRCEEAPLRRARLLAHEALAKLHHEDGLLRGHPAKATYQANDGVGFLLQALLEPDAAPERWRPAL